MRNPGKPGFRGGEGRLRERSERRRGGGTTLAPCLRPPPTPDPSPPLASLAGGGEQQRLPAKNRLRGIAHRLDVLSGVQERDDAARAAFEALVAPGEGADQAALAEHELDVAAQVLGVQQPFLERPVV